MKNHVAHKPKFAVEVDWKTPQGFSKRIALCRKARCWVLARQITRFSAAISFTPVQCTLFLGCLHGVERTTHLQALVFFCVCLFVPVPFALLLTGILCPWLFRRKRIDPCPLKMNQILEASYTFILEGAVNQQSALATPCYIHVLRGQYDTL